MLFLVDAFPDFATGLYFSTVTFSTLGFGDVLPPEKWRLFAALEAVNGFLLIGLSTAYLVAASTRSAHFAPENIFNISYSIWRISTTASNGR